MSLTTGFLPPDCRGARATAGCWFVEKLAIGLSAVFVVGLMAAITVRGACVAIPNCTDTGRDTSSSLVIADATYV